MTFSKIIGAKYLLLLTILYGVLILSCLPKKAPSEQNDSKNRAEHENTGESETLVKIRDRGVLKVGFSSFNPWAMQDATGKWIGYEIDVARKFADDLEVGLELVPTAWSGIIPALLTGKFDVIIGGMGITDERAEQVSFSVPYEYAKTTLLLSKQFSSLSLEELSDPQYIIVGRAGSTPFILAQKLYPKAQHKAFDDDGLAIQDLLNNQAQALVSSSIEAATYVADYPESVFVPSSGKVIGKDDIGFALSKNVEAAWLEHINQWIEDNWENKFLEEKSTYWFESREWVKDHQLIE